MYKTYKELGNATKEEKQKKKIEKLSIPDALEITSKDHRMKLVTSNRVVCIKIYATWCEPCKVTKPEYNKLALKYNKEGEILFASEDLELKLSQVGAVPSYLFFVNGEFLHSITGGSIEEVEKTLLSLLE